MEVVPHHFLAIFLGDVGDIVPGGLHELVPHNLGCMLIKLQEGLCHGLIVELVCGEGDRYNDVLGGVCPCLVPLSDPMLLQVPALPEF